MAEISLVIVDFDGTLVDTFQSNFLAYQKCFLDFGMILTEEEYRQSFGLSFNEFMSRKGISDISLIASIRSRKSEIYPNFFHLLRVNTSLFDFLGKFKKSGRKIAMASTARRINLVNILRYLEVDNLFDLILTAEDVVHTKPSPEVYNLIMDHFNIEAASTLIFEDSAVGIASAKSSGASYIKIDKNYFI